ncbi:MAG: hypothetical protein WCJ58_05935 [bacterium]
MKKFLKLVLKILLIGISGCLLGGLFVWRNFYSIKHNLDSIILDNNNTDLFPCDAFMASIPVYDSNTFDYELSSEYLILSDYLRNMPGFTYSVEISPIQIVPVGKRCPGKFQYEVQFGGHKERIEIEKMLHNQTLDGIPVYLRNI